ncbi:hypothetical protein FHS30_003314 [Simiduia aestuariiviva]|uniref:Uncharacterized protein n=1 Tax=Simiduia aestuariiviva TaxID=1510459 RepID=A0A839UXL1_9GAMM|nr:hypothetical protein [Simiduia aestuariiviva]
MTTTGSTVSLSNSKQCINATNTALSSTDGRNVVTIGLPLSKLFTPGLTTPATKNHNPLI